MLNLIGPAQHNDKLFLGRVSAVRLIVPEADGWVSSGLDDFGLVWHASLDCRL